MESVVKSYCLDCKWEFSVVEHSIEERTKAMIDHALSTGHDIDSITQTDGTERNERWSASDEATNTDSQ